MNTSSTDSRTTSSSHSTPEPFWTREARLLFSFRGRISRDEFWEGVGVVTLGRLMIFGLMLCFGYSDALTALAFLVMIPSAWVAFAVCVKRLHDVGLPGWLLLVIPGMAVAGMASGLLLLGLVGALGAAPECPEDNGYGPGRSHC